MMKYFYTAVFHTAEEGGYWITFPDFDSIFSQGNTLSEAYEMAVDALGLELYDLEKNGVPFPAASSPAEIKCSNGEVLMLIEIDLDEYKRKNNNTAVKKTLSIPGWLNEAAVAKGINFSAVLQKALKAELEIF